jgi:hypothetical protein
VGALFILNFNFLCKKDFDMNKIKIMLQSLLVLSISGGVIAFKLISDGYYCTTAVQSDGNCAPNPSSCGLMTGVQTTTDPNAPQYCYTTDLGFFYDCSDVTDCTYLTRFTQ